MNDFALSESFSVFLSFLFCGSLCGAVHQILKALLYREAGRPGYRFLHALSGATSLFCGLSGVLLFGVLSVHYFSGTVRLYAAVAFFGVWLLLCLAGRRPAAALIALRDRILHVVFLLCALLLRPVLLVLRFVLLPVRFFLLQLRRLCVMIYIVKYNRKARRSRLGPHTGAYV